MTPYCMSHADHGGFAGPYLLACLTNRWTNRKNEVWKYTHLWRYSNNYMPTVICCLVFKHELPCSSNVILRVDNYRHRRNDSSNSYDLTLKCRLTSRNQRHYIRKKYHITMSAPGPEGSGAASGNRRLQQTQAQVDEVVDIMRVNVDKVLERDQKLSELDDRADALQAGASQFETSAAKLKRKYWWKNCKVPTQ
ncbi:hypothetical protein EPR50_G00041650 [Xyrichtys novacula]|uniref:V-SNARE coiled-coil homology domain-containing protein n=1 Tax=Xyrichtys novacula TaxID=13765 RepID=A0AAV1ES71_XYRNO|nr:hypothetical protein EPR50_G00041650 [Xyrichtys novacula]